MSQVSSSPQTHARAVQPKVDAIIAEIIRELRLPDTSNSAAPFRMNPQNRDAVLLELFALAPTHGLTVTAALKLPPIEFFSILRHSAVILRHLDFFRSLCEALRMREPFVQRSSDEARAFDTFANLVGKALARSVYNPGEIALPSRKPARAWASFDALKKVLQEENNLPRVVPGPHFQGGKQEFYDQFIAHSPNDPQAIALKASRSLAELAACEARGTYVTSVRRQNFCDRLGWRLLERNEAWLRQAARRLFGNVPISDDPLDLLVKVVCRSDLEDGPPNSPARRDFDKACQIFSIPPRVHLVALLLREQGSHDLADLLRQPTLSIEIAKAIVAQFNLTWEEHDWQKCAQRVVDPIKARATVARAVTALEGDVYRACVEENLPPGGVATIRQLGHLPAGLVTSPGINSQTSNLPEILKGTTFGISERGLMLFRKPDRSTWLLAPGMLSPDAPEEARWAEPAALPNWLAYGEIQLIGDYCCVIPHNLQLLQVYYRTREIKLPAEFREMIVRVDFEGFVEDGSEVFISGLNRKNNQRQFLALDKGEVLVSPMATYAADAPGAVVLNRPLMIGAEVLLGAKPGAEPETSVLILYSAERGFYEISVPIELQTISADSSGMAVWMVARHRSTGTNAVFKLRSQTYGCQALALLQVFVTSGTITLHHCSAETIIEERRPGEEVLLRRASSTDNPILKFPAQDHLQYIVGVEDAVVVHCKRIHAGDFLESKILYYCSITGSPLTMKVDLKAAKPGVAVGASYVFQGQYHDQKEEQVICFTPDQGAIGLDYAMDRTVLNSIGTIGGKTAVFLGWRRGPEGDVVTGETRLAFIKFSADKRRIRECGHINAPNFNSPRSAVLTSCPDGYIYFADDRTYYVKDSSEVHPGFRVKTIIDGGRGNVGSRFVPFGAILGRQTEPDGYEIRATNEPKIQLRYDAEPQVKVLLHGKEHALVTIVGLRAGQVVIEQFTLGTTNTSSVSLNIRDLKELAEGRPIEALLQDAQDKIPNGIFEDTPPLLVQVPAQDEIARWVAQLVPGTPMFPMPASREQRGWLTGLVVGGRGNGRISSPTLSGQRIFEYQSRPTLAAGDPRERRRGEPVLVVRGGKPADFIVTERFGPWDFQQHGWGDLSFLGGEPKSIAQPRKYQFQIAVRPESRVVLAVISGGEIDPLSIQYVPDGETVSTDIRRTNAGTMVVDVPIRATGILYDVLVETTPQKIVWPEEAAFKRFFAEQNPVATNDQATVKSGTDRIPDVLLKLIAPLRERAPEDRLSALNRLLSDIGVYDVHSKNQEIVSPASCLRKAMARLEELRATRSVGRKKVFAGVCTDFAVIGAMLARELEFVAGVDCGFKADGKRYFKRDAHAVFWVAVPQEGRKPEIVQSDPTAPLRVFEAVVMKARNVVDFIARAGERSARQRVKTSPDSELPSKIVDTAERLKEAASNEAVAMTTAEHSGNIAVGEELPKFANNPEAIVARATATPSIAQAPVAGVVPVSNPTAALFPADSAAALQIILDYWRFGRSRETTPEAAQIEFAYYLGLADALKSIPQDSGAPEQLVADACKAEGGGDLSKGKVALREFLLATAPLDHQQHPLYSSLVRWLSRGLG